MISYSHLLRIYADIMRRGSKKKVIHRWKELEMGLRGVIRVIIGITIEMSGQYSV